jgi:hypothetical protein
MSDAENEESDLPGQRRRARRLRRIERKKGRDHAVAHHDHSSHAHDEEGGCGFESERSSRIRRRRKKKGEVAPDQAVSEPSEVEAPLLNGSDLSVSGLELPSSSSESVRAQQVAYVNLKPAAAAETSADVSSGSAPASEAAVAESAGAATAGAETAADIGGAPADAAGGASEAAVALAAETSADVNSGSAPASEAAVAESAGAATAGAETATDIGGAPADAAGVSGSAEDVMSQVAYDSISENASNFIPVEQYSTVESSDSLAEGGVGAQGYSTSGKASLSDLLGMSATSSFGHEVGHPSVRRFDEIHLGDAGLMTWPQLNMVMGASTSIHQGLGESHSVHQQSAVLYSSLGDASVE